jgi:uncharacterized membrane protein
MDAEVIGYFVVAFVTTCIIDMLAFNQLRKREEVEDAEVWGVMTAGFGLGMIWPITGFLAVFCLVPFFIVARILKWKHRNDQEKEEKAQG